VLLFASQAYYCAGGVSTLPGFLVFWVRVLQASSLYSTPMQYGHYVVQELRTWRILSGLDSNPDRLDFSPTSGDLLSYSGPRNKQYSNY